MAQIINGKDVAAGIRQKLTQQMQDDRRQCPDFAPGLAIVRVGDKEGPNKYIEQTMEAAKDVGVDVKLTRLPNTTTEQELTGAIEKLNDDTTVHGIIVLLPLDSIHPINKAKILDTVSPAKDVDGLHAENAGRLSRGELEDCIVPCSSLACLELIKHAVASVTGKRAVVVGMSEVVGMSTANLLTWNHATVTVCHSSTANLKDIVKDAEIVVAEIDQAEFVKGDWIKPGAVVIDCGFNFVDDSTCESGKRQVGDVEFDKAKDVASWITPHTGGVESVMIAMLMRNTVQCAERILKQKMSG